MHESFYTSPTSCKIKSCQGIGDLRDTYHPLFDKHEADLVIGAHLHNYQRTVPLEYHLNVDITNKGQILTAKFIQNNGKIFDSFSITK